MIPRLFLRMLVCLAVSVSALQAEASCGPRYAKLASSFSELRMLPEMAELLRKAGLAPNEELLRANSSGIMDAREFLNSPLRKSKGFLLATDGLGRVQEFFARPNGLRHWSDGYREMRLHPKALNRTPLYMEKITETGEPVVFLVPPGLMEHPGITKDEMLWLLGNPGRMKNVTFVFGAYDLFPPEVLERFSRSRDWTEIHRLLGD